MDYPKVNDLYAYWRAARQIRRMMREPDIDLDDLEDHLVEIEALMLHTTLPTLRAQCFRFHTEVSTKLLERVAQ